MDSWNLEYLFIIQSMWWTKPINCFENGGDHIFSQICRGDEISRESRQFWTETQHQWYDKLNKGGHKLNFVLENLTIP
jgi:hypothetical protein